MDGSNVAHATEGGEARLANIQLVMTKLSADDFKPLDDWRASAGYRLKVAGNLLRRLYLRSTGVAVELDAL